MRMTETMTNKKVKLKKANVNRDMIDRLALVAKERRSRSKVSDDNIVDLTNESSQEEASPSVERKLISRTTLPSYVLRFIRIRVERRIVNVWSRKQRVCSMCWNARFWMHLLWCEGRSTRPFRRLRQRRNKEFNARRVRDVILHTFITLEHQRSNTNDRYDLELNLKRYMCRVFLITGSSEKRSELTS